MEQITDHLADQIYTILVRYIGAPDVDYLRWSFQRSLVVLKVKEYAPNNKIERFKLRFRVDKLPRVVIIDGITSQQGEAMIRQANRALAQLVRPVATPITSPVEIRPIPIQPSLSDVFTQTEQIFLGDTVPIRVADPPIVALDPVYEDVSELLVADVLV